MDDKTKAGMEKLKKDGHTVEGCLMGDICRYKIDGGTTITPNELREIGDGIYSYEELEKDLLVRRLEEDKRTS